MFATFSIFWSTLIFFVSSPAYYWGPKEVGILAILVYRAFVAPSLVVYPIIIQSGRLF